jgi:hypothetical protein
VAADGDVVMDGGKVGGAFLELVGIGGYCNTLYVLYRFIPVTVKSMVFVGIGIVMEVDTHSIPMINLTADSSA